MYIKVTDGVITGTELKSHPGWIMDDGSAVTDEWLATNEGLYLVDEEMNFINQTIYNQVTKNDISEWTVDVENKKVFVTYTETVRDIQEVFNEQRTLLLANLADLRWRYETGGVNWTNTATQSMYRIHTDRESQSKILSEYVTSSITALREDGEYFKTMDGFVPLTNAEFLDLSTSVRVFIKNCYYREAMLIATIMDTSVTTVGALETIRDTLVPTGWPTEAIYAQSQPT